MRVASWGIPGGRDDPCAGIERRKPVGNFCGVGNARRTNLLRCDAPPADLPGQVTAVKASEEDVQAIEAYVDEFCRAFGEKKGSDYEQGFLRVASGQQNPYTHLYTQNWEGAIV